MELSYKQITVAARPSLLSRAQVDEVYKEICQFYPLLAFDCLWIETKGDRDFSVSLRSMDKTDFFTYDIDILQLAGHCRISIHSAKDLPDPIPSGLILVALTKGVDPSDVLILREGETLETLIAGASIGTSSIRRENNIHALRPDLKCVDIRGTIPQRLHLLDSGMIDGLVMAEAACIRLKLTRRRFKLTGSCAPLQGRLAILAREGDIEMRQLFACIDAP